MLSMNMLCYKVFYHDKEVLFSTDTETNLHTVISKASSTLGEDADLNAWGVIHEKHEEKNLGSGLGRVDEVTRTLEAKVLHLHYLGIEHSCPAWLRATKQRILQASGTALLSNEQLVRLLDGVQGDRVQLTCSALQCQVKFQDGAAIGVDESWLVARKLEGVVGLRELVLGKALDQGQQQEVVEALVALVTEVSQQPEVVQLPSWLTLWHLSTTAANRKLLIEMEVVAIALRSLQSLSTRANFCSSGCGILQDLTAAVLGTLGLLMIDAGARDQLLSVDGALDLIAGLPLKNQAAWNQGESQAACQQEVVQEQKDSLDGGASRYGQTALGDDPGAPAPEPAEIVSPHQVHEVRDVGGKQGDSSPLVNHDEDLQERWAEIQGPLPCVAELAAEVLCSIIARNEAARRLLIQNGGLLRIGQWLRPQPQGGVATDEVLLCGVVVLSAVLGALGEGTQEEALYMMVERDPAGTHQLMTDLSDLVGNMMTRMENDEGRMANSTCERTDMACPEHNMAALLLEYGSLALWGWVSLAHRSGLYNVLPAVLTRLRGSLRCCCSHLEHCKATLWYLSGTICQIVMDLRKVTACMERHAVGAIASVEDTCLLSLREVVGAIFADVHQVFVLDPSDTQVAHAQLLCAGLVMYLAEWLNQEVLSTPGETGGDCGRTNEELPQDTLLQSHCRTLLHHNLIKDMLRMVRQFQDSSKVDSQVVTSMKLAAAASVMYVCASPAPCSGAMMTAVLDYMMYRLSQSSCQGGPVSGGQGRTWWPDVSYLMVGLWCIARNKDNRSVLLECPHWLVVLQRVKEVALNRLARYCRHEGHGGGSGSHGVTPATPGTCRLDELSASGAFHWNSMNGSCTGTATSETPRIQETQRVVHHSLMTVYLLLSQHIRDLVGQHETDFSNLLEHSPYCEGALAVILEVLELPDGCCTRSLKGLALEICRCLVHQHQVLGPFLLTHGLLDILGNACSSTSASSQFHQGVTHLVSSLALHPACLQHLGGFAQVVQWFTQLLNQALRGQKEDSLTWDMALLNQVLRGLARLSISQAGREAITAAEILHTLSHIIRAEMAAYGQLPVSGTGASDGLYESWTHCPLSALQHMVIDESTSVVGTPRDWSHGSLEGVQSVSLTGAGHHGDAASAASGILEALNDGGGLALACLLNLSSHSAAQVKICRHALYTLIKVAHQCPDQYRAAVASTILTNIHRHKENASAIYRAELRLRYANVMAEEGMVATKKNNAAKKAPLPTTLVAGLTSKSGQCGPRPLSAEPRNVQSYSMNLNAPVGAASCPNHAARIGFLRWSMDGEAHLVGEPTEGHLYPLPGDVLQAKTIDSVEHMPSEALLELVTADPAEIEALQVIKRSASLEEFHDGRLVQGTVMRRQLHTRLQTRQEMLWKQPPCPPCSNRPGVPQHVVRRAHVTCTGDHLFETAICTTKHDRARPTSASTRHDIHVTARASGERCRLQSAGPGRSTQRACSSHRTKYVGDHRATAPGVNSVNPGSASRCCKSSRGKDLLGSEGRCLNDPIEQSATQVEQLGRQSGVPLLSLPSPKKSVCFDDGLTPQLDISLDRRSCTGGEVNCTSPCSKSTGQETAAACVTSTGADNHICAPSSQPEHQGLAFGVREAPWKVEIKVYKPAAQVRPTSAVAQKLMSMKLGSDSATSAGANRKEPHPTSLGQGHHDVSQKRHGNTKAKNNTSQEPPRGRSPRTSTQEPAIAGAPSPPVSPQGRCPSASLNSSLSAAPTSVQLMPVLSSPPEQSPQHFFFSDEPDINQQHSLYLFEHVDGCKVCESLYPHYQLPNGRRAHYYYLEAGHLKSLRVALAPVPSWPWHYEQELQYGLPQWRAMEGWMDPGNFASHPTWCPVPPLAPWPLLFTLAWDSPPVEGRHGCLGPGAILLLAVIAKETRVEVEQVPLPKKTKGANGAKRTSGGRVGSGSGSLPGNAH